MYLEMQIVDDTADQNADSKGCRSVGSVESVSDTEDCQERLVALLQCAYCWSRMQALQQVAQWSELESDEVQAPRVPRNISGSAKSWWRLASVGCISYMVAWLYLARWRIS